jgi:hypothetical protein
MLRIHPLDIYDRPAIRRIEATYEVLGMMGDHILFATKFTGSMYGLRTVAR